MKRVVCLLLTILLLAGCSDRSRPDPPSYAVPLRGTVCITTPQMQINADWEYTAQAMTFTVTRPQTLYGVQVTCGVEKTVTAEGITVPMAQTAYFETLQKAWQTLLSASVEPVETAEGFRCDLAQTDGFTVWLSADGSVVQFRWNDDTLRAIYSVERTQTH